MMNFGRVASLATVFSADYSASASWLSVFWVGASDQKESVHVR